VNCCSGVKYPISGPGKGGNLGRRDNHVEQYEMHRAVEPKVGRKKGPFKPELESGRALVLSQFPRLEELGQLASSGVCVHPILRAQNKKSGFSCA
jgi:hypothetical protein